MSNYPEIDPSEIRKGDKIRAERNGEGIYLAVEYVADHFGQTGGDGPHFLISRPTPPVELPETPTLGRLTWDTGSEGGTEVAEWMVHGDGVFGGSTRVPMAGVTEFVPGSFVPADALTPVRHEAVHSSDFRTREKLTAFLAAIDEANGAPR